MKKTLPCTRRRSLYMYVTMLFWRRRTLAWCMGVRPGMRPGYEAGDEARVR